jgi:hypothetical protein
MMGCSGINAALNVCVATPKDQAQRPPLETSGRLQESPTSRFVK